ncbi:uncharacterized protein LOC120289509 [Eucalyptus grandis]|uniref:uncharacterized protein LOC120289509 n=1 Tax=Eucalyptus grandis TaxID=71139 RepID=UPI00192EDA31|nr:uncharacterized protein LOC120289509 [Eucalyptus grandis]
MKRNAEKKLEQPWSSTPARTPSAPRRPRASPLALPAHISISLLHSLAVQHPYKLKTDEASSSLRPHRHAPQPKSLSPLAVSRSAAASTRPRLADAQLRLSLGPCVPRVAGARLHRREPPCTPASARRDSLSPSRPLLTSTGAGSTLPRPQTAMDSSWKKWVPGGRSGHITLVDLRSCQGEVIKIGESVKLVSRRTIPF